MAEPKLFEAVNTKVRLPPEVRPNVKAPRIGEFSQKRYSTPSTPTNATPSLKLGALPSRRAAASPDFRRSRSPSQLTEYVLALILVRF